MPEKFDMQSPPFACLTTGEQKTLRNALDIAYFRRHQVVVEAQQPSHSLYIVIKGFIEEKSAESGEIYAHYTQEDLFDVRALFEPLSKHRYVALEDTLTYLLPKAIFLQFYQQNEEFASYFNTSLVTRRALLEKAHQQKNIAEFILTKVDSSIIQPALQLRPNTTIEEATLAMTERAVDCALVLLSPETKESAHNTSASYAIITQTNLLHALVIQHQDLTSPIGPIATTPVLAVEQGDYLFDAMVQMTRRKVKRLMVTHNGSAVGMLDMTQILSIFSTHSHIITLAIARADNLEALAEAANKQRVLVESLYNRGVRTRFIMELISAVNEQIIEKAFSLLVPPERQKQCCLMVLGSEGRHEQILKTDQDNALIIANHADWPDYEQTMQQVTQTLLDLGYPLCPGGVMVKNSQWVKSQQDWDNTLQQWCQSRNAEELMRLAIVADAHCVAGDAALMASLKHTLNRLTLHQEALLADFARPALAFSSPLTLFGQVKQDKSGLDIKQGGIFPVVHGIRTLGLEYGISVTNTFERISALQQKRVLDKQTAENLSEALKLFFKLRLAQQLKNHQNTNQLNVRELDRAERDLLRHSLHVVKKFKQWLAYHYQIRD